MNVKEALLRSIEYEKRVREVYELAREKSSDPVGRKIFSLLAHEEAGHITYLNDKLKELEENGRVRAGDLSTDLPDADAIRCEVVKLKTRMQNKDHDEEVDMLKKARDVEFETSSFYKRMVSELGPGGRELFSRFVEIEEGHLSLVQAEIDSLTGSGYWFDMKEFDIESGF